jgi:hypothetical protein
MEGQVLEMPGLGQGATEITEVKDAIAKAKINYLFTIS